MTENVGFSFPNSSQPSEASCCAPASFDAQAASRCLSKHLSLGNAAWSMRRCNSLPPATASALPNEFVKMDLDGAPPIFSSARTAFKWRLPASLWDGSYRASGTERNRIGVVRLSIGTARIVGSRAECSMVFSGASNSGPFARVAAAAVGGEFVVAASLQHVGRTASMPGWTRQSHAAATLVVSAAFLHYGCFGPYGGIDSIRQRQLRWHLSEIFLGQVPPAAPRPPSSSRAGFSRREEVRTDTASARTQRPFRPATLRPTLTGDHSHPGRSLARRRHRRQRPHVDGRGPCGHCCRRCCRYRPLRGL